MYISFLRMRSCKNETFIQLTALSETLAFKNGRKKQQRYAIFAGF